MYLILLSKVIRWGWIFGIMSAALYAYICFNVSLYFQSILQCIYVFAGLWGFWSWSELKEPSETGTYHLPIKENIIFPELDIDKVKKILGMDITIVTTAKTTEEGKALLEEFGFPFVKNN